MRRLSRKFQLVPHKPTSHLRLCEYIPRNQKGRQAALPIPPAARRSRWGLVSRPSAPPSIALRLIVFPCNEANSPREVHASIPPSHPPAFFLAIAFSLQCSSSGFASIDRRPLVLARAAQTCAGQRCNLMTLSLSSIFIFTSTPQWSRSSTSSGLTAHALLVRSGMEL